MGHPDVDVMDWRRADSRDTGVRPACPAIRRGAANPVELDVFGVKLPRVVAHCDRSCAVSRRGWLILTNLQTRCYRIRGVPLVAQIIPGSEGCPAADWVRIMERQ